MAYFDPGSVIWELKSTEKFDALREIVSRARTFTEHPDLDSDAFAEKVVDRERLQSTGFGHGVAGEPIRSRLRGSPSVFLEPESTLTPLTASRCT